MRLFFAILIGLHIFFMVGCSTTNHVSLSGKITREAIRVVMQTPSMRNGGMFEKGKIDSQKASKWRAPKGYTLTKFAVAGVPMELLKADLKTDKVIMQLHGGGYLIGFSDWYRRLALKYSKISKGASVLSVDYRIAPQYTFPAALLDAITAWNWLISQGYKPENIIVVGDSAGGNLALALIEKLRDEGYVLPAAVVCMSPWTDLATEGVSYEENRYKDPLFGEPTPRKGKPIPVRKFNAIAYAGTTNLHDKYLSPAYGDYSNFPPMLIQVGTYEILESDAVTVFEKAKAVHVEATLSRYEGMFHVFQSFQNLPESKRAWNEVTLFIGRYFKN
jgi:epsilon-lactone hydrolase